MTNPANSTRRTMTVTEKERFHAVSSKSFAAARYSRQWLIPDFLAAGLSTVLGGPRKSLKTSIMVDLAVSLATATPFLGRFQVPNRRSVVVFSGEGDPVGLRDTAKQVCAERKTRLSTTGITWIHELPGLYSEADLHELSKTLKQVEAEVVFLDPLFLCLLRPGEEELAANVYAVGRILRQATEACLRAGATPIFIHHISKAANNYGGSSRFPDLDDLTYAGIGESIRQ
jgi:replicative DNA helicase